MKKEADIYEGYSPDVAEILRRRPSWIIRNGLVLIGVLFALGLFATWFIPYPESVNIPLNPVYDGMISQDSVAITGSAALPMEYAGHIRTGMQVRIVALPRKGDDLVTVCGHVTGVTTVPAGKNCRVTMLLLLTWREAQSVMNATSVKGTIITRETTILNKIFDPVISIIGGTKTNSQEKGRP